MQALAPHNERNTELSISIMSAYWRDAPYDGTKLLLLLALADYANDSGYCYPTQKKLAEKCRCTERHVRSLMKDLVADGVVRVIDNHRNNRYQLLPIKLSTGTTVPPEKISAGTTVPTDRNPSSYETGNPLPTNHQEPSITTNREPASFDCSWCGRKAIPEGKRCSCSHGRMN